MAKVKVKNTQAVRKLVGRRFKIAINKMLRGKDLRSKVGLIVEKDIRKNFKFTASPVTQKIREYLERYNSTHRDYKRSQINITFTGELLNDLAKNVKANTAKLELIIEHSDKKHKLYKIGKRSKKKRTRKSYKEISEFVIDKGYDYMDISDNASKDILKLIQKDLFKLLRGEFKQ